MAKNNKLKYAPRLRSIPITYKQAVKSDEFKEMKRNAWNSYNKSQKKINDFVAKNPEMADYIKTRLEN